MKRNMKLSGLFALLILVASCASPQYGYDDVYDHDYPAYASTDKKIDNDRGYDDYDSRYEEDDPAHEEEWF